MQINLISQSTGHAPVTVKKTCGRKLSDLKNSYQRIFMATEGQKRSPLKRRIQQREHNNVGTHRETSGRNIRLYWNSYNACLLHGRNGLDSGTYFFRFTIDPATYSRSRFCVGILMLVKAHDRSRTYISSYII